MGNLTDDLQKLFPELFRELLANCLGEEGYTFIKELKKFNKKNPCWVEEESTKVSLRPSCMVTVDSTVQSKYHFWVIGPSAKKLIYPKFETVGPSQYDLKDIELWFQSEQRERRVKSAKVLSQLEEEGIERCLGVTDLIAIMDLGPKIFYTYFKQMEIFAWKSMYKSGKHIWVPSLQLFYDYTDPTDRSFEKKVNLSCRPLSNQWGSKSPALRFK